MHTAPLRITQPTATLISLCNPILLKKHNTAWHNAVYPLTSIKMGNAKRKTEIQQGGEGDRKKSNSSINT